MKRRLALRSERLTNLSETELGVVAGAVSGGCLTGYYRTIEAPCPSVQECIVIGPLPSINDACPTNGCFTGTTGYTAVC
ncbi:MAG TPA: hypothetical protein VF519_04975 [Mycobacteriales bacterium]|jgi:hypothetical protein